MGRVVRPLALQAMHARTTPRLTRPVFGAHDPADRRSRFDRLPWVAHVEERAEAALLIRSQGFALYCAGKGAPVVRCATLAEWDEATR